MGIDGPRAEHAPLPATAAWTHRGARDGFEVVFLRPVGAGYRLEGHTAAVEDGRAWIVRYEILLDERWLTRSAIVTGRSSVGERTIRVDSNGSGIWRVDDTPAPHLDGCLDIDLEASSCTNMMPVRRLRLSIGHHADVPAAYVRAPDPLLERLEQRYLRLEDDGPNQRYDYAAPEFGFSSRIVYDASGVVLEYPGIASRVL